MSGGISPELLGNGTRKGTKMYTFYISFGQLILLMAVFHVCRRLVDYIFDKFKKRDK
jgi:hypothetical protein